MNQDTKMCSDIIRRVCEIFYVDGAQITIILYSYNGYTCLIYKNPLSYFSSYAKCHDDEEAFTQLDESLHKEASQIQEGIR